MIMSPKYTRALFIKVLAPIFRKIPDIYKENLV